MEFTVINKELKVGNVKITGVAASSVFLIGDTEVISLGAAFDTPPEAVTAIVPLPGGRD